MNPATRASSSGDEHSDYDSVLTEPMSDEEVMPQLRFDDPPNVEDGAQGDRVRQTSAGARLAMQVQTAAARAAEGSGTNSPQLDPLRQLQVNQRQQQELLAAPEPEHAPLQDLERLRAEQLELEQRRQEEAAAATQAERQERFRLYQLHRIQMMAQRERQVAAEQEGGVGHAEGGLGVARYSCKACPARFTHHNLMTRHFSDEHPVEKPFPCPDCGRGYVNRDVMEAHYLTVHRGERPFPCDQCDKVFSRAEYLKTHTRVHTGYKPYSCTYCPRRFAWKECVDYHIRTHTGEKPYLCVSCNRDFRGRSALKMHEMIHTESFPFPCTQCERRFRRPYDLRDHVGIAHNQAGQEEDPAEVDEVREERNVTREEQDAAIAALLPANDEVLIL